MPSRGAGSAASSRANSFVLSAADGEAQVVSGEVNGACSVSPVPSLGLRPSHRLGPTPSTPAARRSPLDEWQPGGGIVPSHLLTSLSELAATKATGSFPGDDPLEYEDSSDDEGALARAFDSAVESGSRRHPESDGQLMLSEPGQGCEEDGRPVIIIEANPTPHNAVTFRPAGPRRRARPTPTRIVRLPHPKSVPASTPTPSTPLAVMSGKDKENTCNITARGSKRPGSERRTTSMKPRKVERRLGEEGEKRAEERTVAGAPRVAPPTGDQAMGEGDPHLHVCGRALLRVATFLAAALGTWMLSRGLLPVPFTMPPTAVDPHSCVPPAAPLSQAPPVTEPVGEGRQSAGGASSPARVREAGKRAREEAKAARRAKQEAARAAKRAKVGLV